MCALPLPEHEPEPEEESEREPESDWLLYGLIIVAVPIVAYICIAVTTR